MHYMSNMEVKPVVTDRELEVDNKEEPSFSVAADRDLAVESREEMSALVVTDVDRMVVNNKSGSSPVACDRDKTVESPGKAEASVSSPVPERLRTLREKMRKNGVHAYFIPSSDFHGSEYTNDYFKLREYFSGFKGSAGELLVTQDEALLWTDGRYFIQAERELKDTGITLMRAGEDGVDTVEEYLKKNMSSEAVLGFDGRTVSVSKAESLKKAMPSKKISYKKDLSKGIFIRPEFPESEIRTLDEALTGEPSSNKLSRLREELKKAECDAVFISKPEETAWLFNIRANDIRHTPVALAYSYITEDKAYIFVNNGESLEGSDDVIIRAYEETGAFLKKENKARRVMIDRDCVNYRCFKYLKKKSRVVFADSPVERMKAVKNETELSHIRDIYHKDSLQLTRFIKWLTECNESITETEAAEKLLSFRKEIPGFYDISFTTIAAYGENAAVIHYEPSSDNAKKVEKKGLFMVDSGGQYDGGTTDVTRTVVMGDLTKEEREAFTLVTLGMLRLMNARFLKGSTGQNLDVLARERLWQKGMDYRHGTGHGIGYMLSVHEGPQCIRMKAVKKNAALKPGMLVSDEPGVYREGEFGVRTENILLVEEDMKTSDGEFFRFKNLTEVPIDDKGMDRSLMSKEELEMYIDYQKKVCEALAPELTEEERSWLYRYAGIAE